MIIFFLLISSIWSFEKDFYPINDRSPLEFQHLFESLKFNIKDNSDKVRLVSFAESLNENLKFLKKEDALNFIKVQTTKGALEYHFSQTQSPPVTTAHLDRLKANLEKNDKIYHAFSKWMIRSMIADLNPYVSNGLINKYSFANANSSEEGIKIAKLKRIIRYLGPWINAADSMAPQDFNALTEKAAWHILELLKEKSELQLLTKHDNKEAAMTFNVPSMDYLFTKKKIEEKPILSIKDRSLDEKKEAEELIQKVEVDPLTKTEDLSEAIDEKLEELPIEEGVQ